MIQRKQTLFLFQLVFLGIALLFISVAKVTTNTGSLNVYLIPFSDPSVTSTPAHMAAIALNFLGLILSCLTVFLYRKRELQIKLCYALMVIWLVITVLVSFCHFVEKTDTIISVENNYFGAIIGLFGMLAAWLAARFIRKDIELLKSADRIR